jgi:hypothetical protein
VNDELRRRDLARLAVSAGLAIPGILSLVVLVVARLALPADVAESANDPVVHSFFGIATLPFTLGGIVALWTHPIDDRVKTVLAWTALALALLATAYGLGGWRLLATA